ncbi:hypothetical protein NQ315_000396 [Exocentrus adspersus]|uniref:C2HC/C3H-type domain-containing protein n=1 Tax=Exocentrus adspersus TaxID=1586481 RepID=A0AAV8VLZ0_9CUCU|nr:hypothetical protein NQ315_000396 [Exocentrus adspersus]
MLKSLFPWKHHKTKAMAAQQTMVDEAPETIPDTQELLPCHVCGRTFLPAPLRKHERICERTSTKKRKPFDSLKQRVEGTDLADFHQKSYLRKPEGPSAAQELKKKGRSNWKEKHLALVSAIRAAKGVPADTSPALPKTKSTTALMAGTERCPSCDRQFGPKAYDRHVEWCKEKKAQQRIHHSPANVLLAKERLEARTKYVPPLNRTKKALVREKYSTHTSTETLISLKSTSPLSRGPSVRKPRSVVDMGRGKEKAGEGEEKKERSRFDKSGTGGGDKAKRQESAERCQPVIASPSSKTELKNVQKKRTTLPFTRLNNVKVNNQIDALTVASLRYDVATKKMVTWRDTVKNTAEFETNQEAVAVKTLNVTSKSSQSVKVRQKQTKIECDKILSCNDVLYKDPPTKIPLSKYSFKNKLNLMEAEDKATSCRKVNESTSMESTTTVTVESSSTDMDDSNIDAGKRSSCNSVADAFEKLQISSQQDFIKSHETKVMALEDLESDSLIDLSSCAEKQYDCLDQNVLATKSMLNTRNGMSDWFDGYMKKAQSVDCIDGAGLENVTTDDTCFSLESATKIYLEDDDDIKVNDMVLLFKSSTNLDLTKDPSDFIFDEKKSCLTKNYEETFELDSIEPGPSHFSLKKSSSDICVQNTVGLSGKNTLVSIYWNKNKETSDEESVDVTKMFVSLPNICIKEVTFKEPSREGCLDRKTKVFHQNESLRRKILEIAAQEFIDEYHTSDNKQVEDETSSVGEDPLLNFLEEEYTVPKKRRKVDNSFAKRKQGKVYRFSAATNFDLDKLKRLTKSEETNSLKYQDAITYTCRSDSTICDTSSTTSNFNDYSPRIFTILDNIMDNDQRRVNDKNLLVMTPSDCRRLIHLDKEKLPELQRHLRKIKRRYAKHRIGDGVVKLPAIENKQQVPGKDKEVQVEGALHLPRIVDRKLQRREYVRKLEVDIRKGVGDVYLEYDGESQRSGQRLLVLPPDFVKKALSRCLLKSAINYNPFESAQRQFMELLECDDFKNLAPTCTPVQHTPRPHTSHATPAKQPSPVANKKSVRSAEPKLTKVAKTTNRASVIEPPSTFKDSMDSVHDDFELMENLINDNFTNSSNSNSFYLHPKQGRESLTLSDILGGSNNNRKYSDDMSCIIDPMLINENDNLSIPEGFRVDDYSPTTTDTDVTIQNDVDHYSVQYDNKIAAYEPKLDKKIPSIRQKSPAKAKPIVKRSVSLVDRAKTETTASSKASNKKLTNRSKVTSKSVSSVASTKAVNADKKKGLSLLKRSMTLFDPSPKPPALKNKNDVNNYFSEQQHKNSANAERNSPAKETNDLVETLKPEDLFNVDDEMYEEYKKYEEMYLKEKAQKSATRKHKPKIIDVGLGVHTASEEEERTSPFNNKISNDSAYGSLTRKTPKHRSRATKLTPLEQKQPDSTSSSGSEQCPSSPAVANNQRFSKFCHECGNKYPLTTAKFCVECGVRRLVL